MNVKRETMSKRNRQWNICSRLQSRQIIGCGIRGIHDVPEVLFTTRDEDIPETFFLAVQSLSSYGMAGQRFKLCDLKGMLQELLKNVKIDPEEALLDTPISKHATEIVVSFGLIETLLDILVFELFDGMGSERESGNLAHKRLRTCKDEYRRECNMLLQIVHECLQKGPQTNLLHLATKYRLLEALFSLLADHSRHTRDYVMNILDVILCSESDAVPVQLSSITGIAALFEQLKGGEMAHLYHVLSAMLSVSEFSSIAHSSLEKYDTWLVESGFAHIMEGNHRFLLDQPGWLEEMCGLVCRPLDETDRQLDVVSRVFMQLELRQVDIYSLFNHHMRERDGLFFHVALYKEKALRGDIFLILSLLLNGKFRDEVQSRLVECRVLPKLYVAFQQVVWAIMNDQPYHLNPDDPGSDSDECSLDMFVRIQFLRFVYSVADNHSNRYLLLSREDVARITDIAGELGLAIPAGLRELVDRRAFDLPGSGSDVTADGSRGVLLALIGELRHESPTSCVRFWITRALEAFLRGETVQLNQAFLLEQRLVEDTVSLLISGKARNEMVMQGSFDFLSTLMKFNVRAFERCNDVLDCTDKVRTLIRLTKQNLVDSNMFLRCIILTAAHIRDHLPDQIDFIEKCRLLQFFSKMEKCVDFAVRLSRLLTVATLSQENVSCLNTSLLILILAHRDQQLSTYLKCIRDMKDGFTLLENLRLLLRFWIAHYTLPIKSADCKSLETSTAVEFSEWQQVVGKLIASDPASSDSIEHHLRQPQPSADLQRRKPQPAVCKRPS